MTAPSVLLVARFDDALHAHAAHRRRALERLGCRVTCFDLLKRPGLLTRLTGGDLKTRLARTLESESFELILVVGGVEVEEGWVDDLRPLGRAKWVNWFPDDLRTIREAADRGRPYDEVVAASTDVAGALAGALGRIVATIPLAADPSVYRPVNSRDQFRANVVFAGSATARREALLTEVVEFGLALWGPGWRRTSLKDYCRGEVPSTEDYVSAYSGASVAINIHHVYEEARQPEAHCNQRLFELASIGVLQVTDERTDLPRVFAPGQDLLVFRNASELRALVKDALQDPATGERLAASARRVVLARHTYMHRMSELLTRCGFSVPIVGGPGLTTPGEPDADSLPPVPVDVVRAESSG